MRRIYHPYTRWEDYHAGMWRRLSPSEEESALPKAIEFTGDALLYGSFMHKVAEMWPLSCEHNLSDAAMNRRAWLGHAAACLAIQSPEYITRRAWWLLTDDQRRDADAQAERWIKHWETNQGSHQMELQYD